MSDTTHEATQGRVRSFIERVERLEEERKTISDDIKEVYDEAGGEGFDKKALRNTIRLRKMDRDARDELDTLTELYLSAADGEVAF